MKRLHIFRPGSHTAVDGRTFEFTETQVKASAEAYDPAKHEAPLVVGHPKTDDPAYGWTKSLSFAAGVLVAEPDQVEPQFAEMVNAGRFKKISARFYLPDAPGNPVPGVYYLRHIGFLGAAAPAVKGLKSASFSEDEEGVVEFAEEWTMRSTASLFRRLRDFLISKFTLEEVDSVMPSYLVEDLEGAARGPQAGAAFSEPSAQEKEMQLTKDQLDQQARDIAEREEKLRLANAAFAEREAKVKAQELAARRDSIGTHVDALVKEGRVLPVQRDGLVAFMASLSEGDTIEFGEGEKREKKSALDWLKGYLAAQPKVVDFRERAPAGGGSELPDNANAEDIAKRAADFMESERKAGRHCNSAAAVEHVTRGAE